MMLRRSLQGFVGGVVRRGLPGNRAAFSSSGAAFYYEMPSVSVDERGDSVFGTLRIPLDKDGGEIGQLSRLVSGTGTFLRRTPGTYNFSWHQAPRRQFIVNLDAAVEVTVTNGDKRVMDKGDVFFVEDISGTGHFSKAVGGKTRHSMFITVDDTALRNLGAFCVRPDGEPAQSATKLPPEATSEGAPERRVRARVFDVFGQTLVDLRTAPNASAAVGQDTWDRVAKDWAREMARFSCFAALSRGDASESPPDVSTPKGLLESSLESALAVNGLGTDIVEAALTDLSSLQAFPEVSDVLQSARDQGETVVVAVNEPPQLVQDVLRFNGLDSLVDVIVTPEDSGATKPDPAAYQFVIDRVQIPPEDIVFASASCLDASAAARVGLRSSWVNRTKAPVDRIPGADRVLQFQCLRGTQQ